MRTPRGRVATRQAYLHFGLEMPHPRDNAAPSTLNLFEDEEDTD